MGTTYVDEMMAYLVAPSNMASFATAAGLAAYAGSSFTRRYGQDGFQVDGVTLGAAQDLQVQVPVDEDLRITGTREWRRAQPDRQQIDYRVHRRRHLGWVDVTFAAPASFSLHAVPGSLSLGPGSGAQQAGVAPGQPPASYRLRFSLPVSTEPFTLDYTLQVFLFLSADPAPTDDLRRIRTVRRRMEADQRFLATLDGPPDQRPYLFAQIYPAAAADGGLLSQAAITQLFEAADVLAAFFTPPG